jgi:hypothetical protein
MVDDSLTIEEDFGGEIIKVKAKKIKDESNEEEEVMVYDVVHFFRYAEAKLSKSEFVTFLKNYMKAVLDKLKTNGVSDEK